MLNSRQYAGYYEANCQAYEKSCSESEPFNYCKNDCKNGKQGYCSPENWSCDTPPKVLIHVAFGLGGSLSMRCFVVYLSKLALHAGSKSGRASENWGCRELHHGIGQGKDKVQDRS